MRGWTDQRAEARPHDLRRQMIAQTSAFLSWALRKERGLPSIPRRRVDQGGFTALLRLPVGRAAADRWWMTRLTRDWFN